MSATVAEIVARQAPYPGHIFRVIRRRDGPSAGRGIFAAADPGA